MNKKQLINEIIDLFDENESLKNIIKRYEINKNQVIINAETEKEKTLNELDNKAKNMLFENMICEWYMPRVEIKEESGDFNFLTFEQWYKALKMEDVITSSYKYLFNFLTYSDLKEYFYDQLKNYFNKTLNDKKMEIVRSKKNE